MIERLRRESLREEWALSARTVHDAENNGSKAEAAALATSTDTAPLPSHLGAADSCERPGSVSHGPGVGGDEGELPVVEGTGGVGGSFMCVYALKIAVWSFLPCYLGG